jgi:ADP-ribose pyrophosphatase
MAARDERALADRAADPTLTQPELLADGYRPYWRYHLTLKGADGETVAQQRDVIVAGKVAVVIPIDLARDEIVLLRQFRLAAHIANGRGELVEFVAGRVEPDEAVIAAARRECEEEIGVAPDKLIPVVTYLTTPGLTDEEVTIFLAAIDASRVRDGSHTSPDGERLEIFRASLDDLLTALDRGMMRGSPVIIGLQWLALNRGRLAALLSP